MEKIDVKKEALEAEERIRPHIRETPLEFSLPLSQVTDSEVFLKLENLQFSGSFKFRGAINKVLSLENEKIKKGLVTASSGNHGVAFAHILRKLGLKGTIFLPENASPTKIEVLRSFGVDLRLHETDCARTEAFARKTAESTGQEYISPYNDVKVVGGQATIGIELERQAERIDAVFVPVGGGSLIGGIAGYLKVKNKGIEIVGCQPENSPVMYESLKAGKIIEMESKPTLSDGTFGGIEEGSITFDLCRDYVDDFVLVKEEEIEEAIKFFLEKQHMLIEGAAALSVASFLKTKKKYRGKRVILIISGSKIPLDKLRMILCKVGEKKRD